MIDIVQYRIRIGRFIPSIYRSQKSPNSDSKMTIFEKKGLNFHGIFCFKIVFLAAVLSGVYILAGHFMEDQSLILQQFYTPSLKSMSNFKQRMIHGNMKRGIINMHINIRSLYNKITEVKNLVKKENPHILGISESELRKGCHDLNSLSIPSYDLILPSSWDIEESFL